MRNRKPYVCHNSELMREWHWERNTPLGLDPCKLTLGMHTAVWWICSRKHEWEAAVNDRARGTGCPYCSGHRLISGENDLQSAYPAIAAQWHPTKNAPLLPAQIAKTSNKSVWWICQRGHEWPAVVANRTRQKSDCPYCGNRKVLSGFNDLLTVNPGLAEDWDYEENSMLPSEIIPGSSKRVAWRCRYCGHKWSAVVSSRNAGAGCPGCGHEYHSSFPEQAIAYYLGQAFHTIQNYPIADGEVDIFLPDHNIAIEYDGLYYHSSPKSRNREKRKLQILSDSGIILISVKEGTENRVDDNIVWCKYHRSYNFIPQMINNLLMVIGRFISPVQHISVDMEEDYRYILSQYLSARKENSLAVRRPELVPFWDVEGNGGIRPEQISYGSNRYYYWHCDKGHQWKERIANLVRGDRCPYCSGRRASPENNLLVAYPQVACEWHPTKNGDLSPATLSPHSNRIVWWLCEVCGHEYSRAIDKRTLRDQGCARCGKKKMARTQLRDRIAARGSLADNMPEVARLWHPTKNGALSPRDVMTGSHNVVWWLCPMCGDEQQKEVRQKVNFPRCSKCGHTVK